MMKHKWNFVGIIFMAFLFTFTGPGAATTKDTLVYVMGAEPVSLDPPNQSDNMSETLIKHIYDLPMQIMSDASLAPGIFSNWEHSADGRTWTFGLRKGVKFHDGTPLNAEAVKFNWERCMSTEKRVIRRGMFEHWAQDIKVIDEHTIQFTSAKPFAPILRFVTHPVNGVVSPAALKKYGDQINRNPVGTGPFRFVEWVPADRIVLERNEEYWGAKPRLKRIVFKFAKETGSRVMMLETGEADLILKIPPVEIERLKNNPKVEVLVRPSNRVIGFYVNTAAPLVNDVRFRRALTYAIDRDSIVKHVMKGLAKPGCSVIGGGTFGSITPECYNYNPQKAKELLKEMGYKGEKLQLWTPQGRYENDRETAEVVQSYWQQAGINVELRVMEFASLERGIRQPPDKVTYQVALLGSAPSTMDGGQTIGEMYVSRNIPPNGRNYSRYNNPEYDKLADAQAVEVDVEKRKEILKQCQELLARDLPFITLYVTSQVVGVRGNLKGLEILPMEVSMVRDAYFQ